MSGGFTVSGATLCAVGAQLGRLWNHPSRVATSQPNLPLGPLSVVWDQVVHQPAGLKLPLQDRTMLVEDAASDEALWRPSPICMLNNQWIM